MQENKPTNRLEPPSVILVSGGGDIDGIHVPNNRNIMENHLVGRKWWDWDWDNGGTVSEMENLNQGPRLPVSAFASYGTINQTPLPQPLKRTSPINRTRNYLKKDGGLRHVASQAPVVILLLLITHFVV